jgi:hypothetical protein
MKNDIKLIFTLKILLLFSTSVIGGHGIVNFFFNIMYFKAMFNIENILIAFSIILYLIGVVVFIYSINKKNRFFLKISVIFDVIAFLLFYIFSINYIQYGLFFLTSLPFMIYLVIIFYNWRKKNNNLNF